MKIISNMVQGSAEWHSLRAARFTASEAAAACGDHKYMTRNDLLKQKATGLVPEVDGHQQCIFNEGHKYEAMARPIAEEIMGEELFPVTCEDDTGTYLASMDGMDMLGLNGWEHKSINEKLKDATAETLEEHYKWQMDHQMMVTGAERVLFMASDGTKENCNWFWYERDEQRIKRLVAAWEQFAKDLANYEPAEEEKPKAEGKSPDSLPALSVQVQGMVTASNLKEFEASARSTLAQINTELQTDQDFADAEKTVKFCKEVEKRLDATKENVLGQMQSVDEVVRSIDAIKEETRQIRLKLDKAVKQQKEQRKLEILNAATDAWQKHVGDLEKNLEAEAGNLPVSLHTSNADFAGAMKGKKTISSLQSACDDEMARAKIEASETAELIRGNIQQLNEHAAEYKFLFRDFASICQKPAGDFAAVIKMRIADYQAEQKAKAEREQAAKAAQEAPAKAEAKTVADPAPAKDSRVSMPAPNEMIQVIANHYGVSFQQATAWLASVEFRVAA